MLQSAVWYKLWLGNSYTTQLPPQHCPLLICQVSSISKAFCFVSSAARKNSTCFTGPIASKILAYTSVMPYLNCVCERLAKLYITKICSKNIVLMFPLSYESVIMEYGNTVLYEAVNHSLAWNHSEVGNTVLCKWHAWFVMPFTIGTGIKSHKGMRVRFCYVSMV